MPLTQSQKWEEFSRNFARSKRGNLWRNYAGVTLTVFTRKDEYFGWCIAGEGDTQQYSTVGWETEEEAIEALYDEVHEW